MAFAVSGIRFTASLLLLFALGTSSMVSAEQPMPLTNYALLDLGDDDGDGIPNYLDPDDNNDGVTDDDTPKVEEPGDTGEDNNPSQSTGNENEEPAVDPTVAPTSDASQPAPESSSIQPGANIAPQPQVTSLPNTGAGITTTTLGAQLAGGIFLLFLLSYCLREVHTQKP